MLRHLLVPPRWHKDQRGNRGRTKLRTSAPARGALSIPPFPTHPSPSAWEHGRAFPSLTDSRVPAHSAPALALMQQGWAWTTASAWPGPAHPSLPPDLCPLGVTSGCPPRDAGLGGEHSSAASKGRRRGLQGTHGARGSSQQLHAASHPGPFPQHTLGSRGEP